METDLVTTSLDARIVAAQTRLDERGLLDALQALVRIPSVYDPAVADGNETVPTVHVADQWLVNPRPVAVEQLTHS